MTDKPEPSPAIRQLQSLLSISMNESMTLQAQICLLEASVAELGHKARLFGFRLAEVRKILEGDQTISAERIRLALREMNMSLHLAELETP